MKRAMLMLIAIGLVIGARPAQGQTISLKKAFLGDFSAWASGVAVDASGVYVVVVYGPPGERKMFREPSVSLHDAACGSW